MNFEIVQKVSEEELNELLEQGLKNSWIGGEQWFRKPENWYAITAYANPYKTPYTEMMILNENEQELSSLLKNTRKIYYGVGIGDTEIIPIRWDLRQNNYSEVIALDVSKTFIESFTQSIRNLKVEYSASEILFKGYVTLFEKSKKEDLKLPKGKYEKAAHFCLGNTIGNFDQRKIFNIFESNMNEGDLLILGVQLNKNPDRILLQYSKNPLFNKFISDSVELQGKLKWKYDPKNDQVEAWINDTMVFRSKKYDLKKLENLAKAFDLNLVKEFKYINGHGGFAICVFTKLESKNKPIHTMNLEKEL